MGSAIFGLLLIGPVIALLVVIAGEMLTDVLTEAGLTTVRRCWRYRMGSAFQAQAAA
jgi:hypothetical protein